MRLESGKWFSVLWHFARFFILILLQRKWKNLSAFIETHFMVFGSVFKFSEKKINRLSRPSYHFPYCYISNIVTRIAWKALIDVRGTNEDNNWQGWMMYFIIMLTSFNWTFYYAKQRVHCRGGQRLRKQESNLFFYSLTLTCDWQLTMTELRSILLIPIVRTKDCRKLDKILNWRNQERSTEDLAGQNLIKPMENFNIYYYKHFFLFSAP